jgi:tetratricopeptide (TPR) repeat protein
LRPIRLVLFLVLCGMAAFGWAVPQVLIVQIQQPVKDGIDPNVPIANLMAAEFDAEGKIEAIVWSMTDPKFRAAAMSGTLRSVPDQPTQQDAVAAAQQLRAEYLIVVQATRGEGGYTGKLEMFRNNRSVWKDDQNVQVRFAEARDGDLSAQSLARTLAMRISTEPLKALKATPRVTTPDPDRGQAPPVVEVPVAVEKASNEQALKEAASLALGPRILFLRDAVDRAPLDEELRTALIAALIQIDPAAAAAEARRASTLMPDVVGLRTIAARAWLQAGNPEEAQNDLNEAVARDPEAIETRLLLAEVALRQGRPESAGSHLDAVIAKEDTPEVRFLRAFSRCLTVSFEGLREDLDALSTLEPSASAQDIERRYLFATQILDRMGATEAADIRGLMQRAAVRPDDREVVDAVHKAIQTSRARSLFLQRLAAGETRSPSHRQRVLASTLLAQALVDLQAFMASGNEDNLADARINFGESLRHAAAAREADARKGE